MSPRCLAILRADRRETIELASLRIAGDTWPRVPLSCYRDSLSNVVRLGRAMAALAR